MIIHKQIQAVAHYDDVRLKSEKAGIYIVTYPLQQMPNRGVLCIALNCFNLFVILKL